MGDNNIIPEIQLPPGVEHQDSGEDWERQGSKVKLMRSHAIRDSTSPPPPGYHGHNHVGGSPQHQTVSEGGSERSIGETNVLETDNDNIIDVTAGSDAGEVGGGGDTVSCADSGRGDTDTAEGEVYTDNTGTDLTQFIITTLNKNSKDRVLMLKLEQDMTNLVKDTKKTHHKFPHMSSYHRMMVHRVAAFFGLDHNVDQSGNCVIVNKTKNTRLPDLKFKDHVVEDALSETPPLPMKLKLMKRENCSCESGDRLSDSNSRRSKSIEEREEEYERAKRRIFNDHKSNHEKPHSDQRLHCLASTKGANQARSFDIRESLTGPADRPAVSKSFSFGGYPQPQHLEPRKQTAASPQYLRPSPPALVKGQVVWAVSDVSTVPSGAVLINPDTGTPYLNSDGSVYMFDPSNPPRQMETPASAAPVQPPSVASYPSTPLPGDMISAEVAKMSLDTDQMSVGSHNSNTSQTPLYPPWVMPAAAASAVPRLPTPAPPAPSPAPPAAHPSYILVNPAVTNIPLPHYLPYLSPAPGHTATPAPPAPSPPRPLLFSLHRSPPHCILYLQHCTSLLTRAQLTSFLDGFLGPASPGLQGGQWQWLDQAGVWCDLLSLPENTPVTQRFPIQIYFDTEDQAAPTITALRQVGFLSLEHNLEQLV